MAEIDPDALLTASQLAAWFEVTVAAVTNWVSRGHLSPAKDSRGHTIKAARGRPLYRLLDGAKAEAAAAEAAVAPSFPPPYREPLCA